MLRTYLYLLIIILALIGGFFSINYPIESAPMYGTATNNRNSKGFNILAETNPNSASSNGDYWLPISPYENYYENFAKIKTWTGEEILIWGWYWDNPSINRGYRYNPTTDVWSEMNTVGAPSSRRYFQAVWTGTEMVIWGGEVGNSSCIHLILVAGTILKQILGYQCLR